MTLAYRDTRSADILISENIDVQRKHLFDTYIARMFERPERSINMTFKNQDVLRWLPWLARKMNEYNQNSYLIERMGPYWLGNKKQRQLYEMTMILSIGLISTLIGALIGGLIGALIGALIGGLIGALLGEQGSIKTVDRLSWSWKDARYGLIFGLTGVLIVGLTGGLIVGLPVGLFVGLILGLPGGLVVGLFFGLLLGLNTQEVDKTTTPGQRINFSIRNALIAFLIVGLLVGLLVGLSYGGSFVIQHYVLRLMLSRKNYLPWKLVPFLDYCTDLIFLRRVGGGYIFVHRLLMEHFAAMSAQE